MSSFPLHVFGCKLKATLEKKIILLFFSFLKNPFFNKEYNFFNISKRHFHRGGNPQLCWYLFIELVRDHNRTWPRRAETQNSTEFKQSQRINSKYTLFQKGRTTARERINVLRFWNASLLHSYINPPQTHKTKAVRKNDGKKRVGGSLWHNKMCCVLKSHKICWLNTSC